MEKMLTMNGKLCACGKRHCFDGQIVSGKGVLTELPRLLQALHITRPYVLMDGNTRRAAGERVLELLQSSGFEAVSYCYLQDTVVPDEHSVGSAAMHYDSSCDGIIAVGSGVLNDIGKIISNLTEKPYLLVATAPSMDGYASATSSMTRSGLKVSLPSRSADVVVGDTDILRKAPLKMRKSGLGDMLAKYVALCEWRISHVVTGEYYCPEIADLVRSALNRCVSHAQGLLNGEEQAVQAVFEGLTISGIAMNYAGLSRPASGAEHYVSHVVDMRAAALGTPEDFHGIQCAVGTFQVVKLYEKLKALTPDREKALAYTGSFSYDAWSKELKALLGSGADSMIALEAKEGKYDLAKHRARLEILLTHWREILQIMEEELPSAAELEQLLDAVGIPKTLGEIGTADELFPVIFKATKDIRNKYVLSHLAWDLGVLEDLLK